MIRKVTQNDISRIVEIYTEVYLAMPEEIDTISKSDSILVYEEESQIIGFAHYILNGANGYLEIGIDSKYNIVEIGKRLWNYLSIELKEKHISTVKTFHVQEDTRWSALFKEIGFEYWYSVYRLKHVSPIDAEIDLKVIDYTDDYFEAKMELESECFEEVRRLNHIQPYNWYAEASDSYKADLRAFINANKDFIKIYMEKDKIIGVSQVKDREIDLIFTRKSEQGKGYGNQILIDSIKRGKAQGDGEVYLNVLAQNDKALRLYKKHGFKQLQTQDCRRIKF